jgi:hypothetical protein
MNIPEEEASLFLKLWLELLLFTNKEVRLFPDCQTIEQLKYLELNDRMTLRDALLTRPELIGRFVLKNPAGFDEGELSIVRTWRNFVAGDFIIERYLARNAIFIKEAMVYKVLALNDSFDHFVGKEELPAFVKTVLLPFKGQIVYDGLLGLHNIRFGGGFRARLREQYSDVKRSGQIIESLEPGYVDPARRPVPARSPVPVRDWRPEIEALLEQAQKLKAERGAPELQREMFKLVKTTIEMAQHAAAAQPEMDSLWDVFGKMNRSMRKIFKVLESAE